MKILLSVISQRINKTRLLRKRRVKNRHRVGIFAKKRKSAYVILTRPFHLPKGALMHKTISIPTITVMAVVTEFHRSFLITVQKDGIYF